MMRSGKPLGTLDWETDRIYLMGSSKKPISKNLEEKIMAGKFIKD